MALPKTPKEIIAEIAEWLALTASGGMTGAVLAQKLNTLGGLPMPVVQKIGDAFAIHFGGRGTQQDELNNWLAVCGLLQFEELDKLPPGMTAQDCIERIANWAFGLMPAQRRSLVLTFGMLFGDVRKTFQPVIGAVVPTTVVPGPTVQQDAFKVAQKEAAETLLPLLWLPDDETRTKVAIGFRLIPKHDRPFEAWQWLKEVELHKKGWAALRVAGKGIGKGTVALAKFLKAASESPEMEDRAKKMKTSADKWEKRDVIGRLFKKIF